MVDGGALVKRKEKNVKEKIENQPKVIRNKVLRKGFHLKMDKCNNSRIFFIKSFFFFFLNCDVLAKTN